MPYDRGDLLSKIHEEGEILESEHVEDGTRVRARVTPAVEADLSDFVVAEPPRQGSVCR